MHLDERVWRIVPERLEGAGYFEMRLRAEAEIRKLMIEIETLKTENDDLRNQLGKAIEP